MVPGEIISDMGFWGSSSPSPAKPAKNNKKGKTSSSGKTKENGVKWIMAATTDNCDIACSKLSKGNTVMECNPASFEETKNATGVQVVAKTAKLKCSKTTEG